MSLTIEQILAANDSGVRKVSCPEWGGDVYVRTLSADERDAFEASVQDTGIVRATLVAVALCSEDGTPLGPSPVQVEALGRKASGPIDRIVEATMELNTMRPQDMAKLEGNSEATDAQD